MLTSLRDQQQNTRDNMIQLQNNLTDLQSNHELLEQSIQTADKDFAATEKPKDPKGAGNSAVKYAAIGFLLGAVLVAGATVCSFLVEGKVLRGQMNCKNTAASGCLAHWQTMLLKRQRGWMQPSTSWKNGRTAV